MKAAVCFCALEALNSVATCTEATRATVTLSKQNGRLTFSVHDDGRGFDPNATGRGTGLQGVADRLEAICGEPAIETSPGGGTTAIDRVPRSGRQS
jgi:signal transduction histidine kinase